MDDLAKKLMTIVQSGEKRDILLLSLIPAVVFTFSITICSFVAAGTANAGFNIVLTSLLNIGYIAGAYYVIGNSKTPVAIGFLLGVTATMTALNFMTAIFWGQLSRCTMGIVITGYSCTNPTAYGAISAFSVLIFLLQMAIFVALVMWRNELISDDSSQYEDTPSGSLANGGYDPLNKGSFSVPSTSNSNSADL